jgi:predicted DCC family thiol-disulfide oxidoreductase YuxK
MEWVLFYDGDCALCTASVRLILRFDKHQRIAFAPLQGRLAQDMNLASHLTEDGGTLVVRREADARLFVRSDGWIELARALGGGWRLFTLVRFVPHAWRDGFYRWVAKNRYRFMGKNPVCPLPDPALHNRMRR